MEQTLWILDFFPVLDLTATYFPLSIVFTAFHTFGYVLIFIQCKIFKNFPSNSSLACSLGGSVMGTCQVFSVPQTFSSG